MILCLLVHTPYVGVPSRAGRVTSSTDMVSVREMNTMHTAQEKEGEPFLVLIGGTSELLLLFVGRTTGGENGHGGSTRHKVPTIWVTIFVCTPNAREKVKKAYPVTNRRRRKRKWSSSCIYKITRDCRQLPCFVRLAAPRDLWNHTRCKRWWESRTQPTKRPRSRQRGAGLFRSSELHTSPSAT